jgi:hypothetical protein
MTLSVPQVRHYLKDFELEKLFVEELGWDRYSSVFDVPIDGNTFTLQAVAQKRGVQIFECRSDDEGKIPDHNLRRRIEKQITKCAYEHLIIFTDSTRTTQIWQWVARTPGQPTAYREHSYHPQYQSGDALIQKLNAIMIPLDEEEAIDLTGTVHKLRDAFDRDRVTKKFYDQFKREHAVFLKFIQGISDQADKEWYASLMLNRLMFVYFIQKKSFLDGDLNYLQNRLKAIQERKGKGMFLTFYRYFLLVLFHEGFSKQPQQRQLDRDLKELLGDIPYLNGGLFEVHELEEKHAKLDIPDEAFENLFTFFDQYEWTLDTRPLRNDREINPDVLGYIFEKYINQKEMGAYYTKEDITEYISKSTTVPFLFDAAKKKCAVAFESGSALWRLLEEDPNRYIYAAVRKGVIDGQGEVIPLPEEIEKGIKSVSQREGWNHPADPDYALPTETWREHVSRRQRCLEIREKLQKGEIHEINDFITYNLNIRQFAEDVIAGSEGPELLRAFYEAISTLTVFDPTCGSGAFLFAALNILEPLYNACLDRMHAFIEDLDRSGERHSPRKFEDFRKTLSDVDRHPNRPYFILKSIIVKNLYGVDIMEEAVEICKLRLFLKLVAQVEKAKDLEPLPDVDFNIRPGNTLVGFVSREEIRNAAEKETSGQGKLVFGQTDKALQKIEEEAEIVERAYQKFHEMQTEYGMDAREFADQKRVLREKLNKLKDELDRYLAKEYGVDPEKSRDFTVWRTNHFPFHWFAEFYGIIRRGGFDAVIGNPPYLERSKFNGPYTLINYQTKDCRDIYSWIVERVQSLRVPVGRIGLIVPVSIVSSGSFDVLRKVISKGKRCLWFSHFANRPSQLFSGAQNRLTIFLDALTIDTEIVSTRYHRWDAKNGEREFLFTQMRLAPIGDLLQSFHGLYPKIGNPEAISVIKKMWSRRSVANWLEKSSKCRLYWVRVPGYFCQFFVESPMAKPEHGGAARARGELNVIYFSDEDKQRVLHAVLNSSTYLQFYCAYTDGRHVNPSDVKEFPFDYESITGTCRSQLIRLSKQLEISMKQNTSYWRKSGLLIESVDSGPTKPILDEIDHALANHYGFTREELDFIINYDIKYRMGESSTEDNDGV